MTDDQMIEIVAQAIRNVTLNRSGRSRREWQDLPPKVRAYFREEAEAAIAAYVSNADLLESGAKTKCNSVTLCNPLKGLAT